MNYSLIDEYKDLDDKTLLVMSNNGNRDAENALILRYLSVVRKKAATVNLVSMELDDIVQEGIIGLLDAIKTYDPIKGAFSTYANVCTENRIKKAIAHANAGKTKVLDNSINIDDISALPTSKSEGSPESIVIEKEKWNSINEQIEKLLSSFEKEVLSLYLYGYSYSQMAKMLDCEEKSVGNALYRVRKKLNALIF